MSLAYIFTIFLEFSFDTPYVEEGKAQIDLISCVHSLLLIRNLGRTINDSVCVLESIPEHVQTSPDLFKLQFEVLQVGSIEFFDCRINRIQSKSIE